MGEIWSTQFVTDPLVDRDYFVKADAFVDGKERRKKKKRKEKENRKTKLEPDAYMYTKGHAPTRDAEAQ